jgi:hypothetical protein
MALISTSGKNLTEEEVADFLRVLVSNTFAWDVKRHSGCEFKALFPTKGDLVKMTRFNADMKEGVTLKFQEFKEDEEYFGHALPVVWMRVLNLSTILKEYLVLWALGSLFGVTQDVDMVTTRASTFGRFAVAVLEPETIPTKLDVIIGNRYFQLRFEVEPYLPNIGLRNIWNTENNGNEGHGNGAPKDSEMGETQNLGNASNSAASGPNAMISIKLGKEVNNLEAQMDIDLEEDDLLGEENDLSDTVRDFVGVKKGHSVDVRVAPSLVPSGSSAPARMQQRSSQLARSGGKAAMVGQEKRMTMGSPQTQQQQTSTGVQMAAVIGAASSDLQKTHNQQPSMLDKESVEARQADGAADGLFTIEDQHLGVLLDAMVDAGVSADGGSKDVLGSVMMMAVLSDGELTPVRRSKRNADVTDVHSLEKAEKRIAIKNLEESHGNVNAAINSVCSFSSDRIKQNLGGVRISLGGKESLIADSVALIKVVENERLKPSCVVDSIDKENESEEDEIDPDISTISRLCGDLMEEVMDDNSAGLDGVLVDIPIKVAKIRKSKKIINRKVPTKKKLFQ